MNVRMKTAGDKFWRRQGIKSVLWMALPSVLILGYFYPVLGFIVLGCMGASIAVSFKKGRAWCDVCPRGTFFDMVMSKASLGRPVPAFLKSKAFRIFMLAFLMTMMTVRLIAVWGDPTAMGMVFLVLLGVTSLFGVVLAVPYKPRAWCNFCPMGSMASWIGAKKLPLAVDPACTECGLCAKVCNMELYPGASRERGEMAHGDCIKCGRCVVTCPKQALSFDKG
ncbi:MAG: 4Fe-4S binding protein [Armatimonadota bacterium]